MVQEVSGFDTAHNGFLPKVRPASVNFYPGVTCVPLKHIAQALGYQVSQPEEQVTAWETVYPDPGAPQPSPKTAAAVLAANPADESCDAWFPSLAWKPLPGSTVGW